MGTSAEVMKTLMEKLVRLAEIVDEKGPDANPQERQAAFEIVFPSASRVELSAFRDLAGIINAVILWQSLVITLDELDHGVPLSKIGISDDFANFRRQSDKN